MRQHCHHDDSESHFIATYVWEEFVKYFDVMERYKGTATGGLCNIDNIYGAFTCDVDVILILLLYMMVETSSSYNPCGEPC